MNQRDQTLKAAAREADIARRLADLSPAKRALYEKRLQDAIEETAESASIPIRSTPGPAPLSFTQEQQWILNRLHPGNAAYNVPRAFRLAGPLKLSALKRSLDEIVRRHEALRTTFSQSNGHAVQRVASIGSVDLVVDDRTDVPISRRDDIARTLATQEAQLSFDLESGPLFRTRLIHFDDAEHILLVTMHHSVSDEWSMGVFFRELLECYESFYRGHTPSLPDLSIQYSDFAHWQRLRDSDAGVAQGLDYFVQQLEGAPPVLALPHDKPRPTVQTFGGAHECLAIPPALEESLKRVAQDNQASLFMLLISAFHTLLHRYTGESAVVTGFAVSGRDRIETENMIGAFVNTLVLRTDPADVRSFRDLIRQVRERALCAYSHQGVPFAKLVEKVQPQRSANHTPIVQVMFNYEEFPQKEGTVHGLRMSTFDFDPGTAPFDLTVEVLRSEEGLQCLFNYNVDLFEPATIVRMSGHYRTLLESIVADPDAGLDELPMLTEDERHQLLVEWNDTHTDYPSDACIHSLFEVHAARTPDAIAIVDDGAEISYRDLNARANRLARYLLEAGVQSGDRVGVYIERSANLYVGLLAILKAGAAYVALDIDCPTDRLATMLGDANASIVLSEETASGTLPDLDLQVVCLDTIDVELDGRSSENVDCRIKGGRIAYVAYTSGSTGAPRGVCIPHRGVVRLVVNTNYIQFTPRDGVAQTSNIAFDASTFEVWGPLTHGGRIVVVRKDTVLSARSLEAAIEGQAISVMFLTTSLFDRIVQVAPATFQKLRCLIIGGEEASPQRSREFLAHNSGVELINGYGPTESTTFAVCHRIDSVDEDAQTVPIGKPISNTQIYILDPHLQPVPIGIPGELHIGGDGLAREYLGDAELTNKKFIRNPLGPSPDARLYKTGDLARYMPDGNIEFLGRLDRQIKLRGYRIELNEIEILLQRHASISQAIVIARDIAPGDAQLLAYIVTESAEPLAPDALRSFLSESLPGYMVPRDFIRLDKFPLTPNGKVDTKALPVPKSTNGKSSDPAEAPNGELETQVVEIWQRLLGTSPIGVTDDFFSLGGHSLLAVQMFAELESLLGKTLSVSTLLHAPTIRQLVRAFDRVSSDAPASSMVPIQLKGTKSPLFLLHAAGGGVLHFQKLAAYADLDRPLIGIQESERAHPDIETYATHYLEELRAIQPEGPYRLGGFCLGGVIAFEMARQLIARREQVASLVIFDSKARNVGWPAPAPIVSAVVRLRRRLRGTKNLLRSATKGPQRSAGGGTGIPLLREDPENYRAIAMMADYLPRPLPVPITLIRGPLRTRRGPQDSSLGWRRVAAAGLDIEAVSGSHNCLFQEPFVREVADALRAALN